MAIVWKPTPVVSTTSFSSAGEPWEYKPGLEVTTTDISDTQTKVVANVWFWSKWSLDSSQYNLYFDFDTTEAISLISNRSDIHVPSKSSWDTANQIKLATFEKTYTRDSSDHIFDCAVKTTHVAGFKNEIGTFSLAYTVPATNTVLETYWFDVNPLINGKTPEFSETFASFDVYINDVLQASGVSDYYAKIPAGSFYEVTNFNSPYYGYTYQGDPSITGTMPAIQWYTVEPNWVSDTFYITYNSNGGTFPIARESFLFNMNETISSNVPTRTGYNFTGWLCSLDSSIWQPGQEIPAGCGSFALTAQWEQAPGLVYIDNGTEFEAYQIFIDNGTNWDQVVLYIDNGSGWDMIS